MSKVAFADPISKTIDESLEEIKEGNEFLRRID